MAQPSETSSAFEIKFTSREVSAWGGMALMKRMLDSMDFRKAASQWDLPEPGSNRSYPPVQLFKLLEGRGINYIISARLTQGLQQAILRDARWFALETGLELAEITYQANRWDRARRIVVVRQSIKRKNAPGKTLSLFADDPDIQGWRYGAMVTSLSLPAVEIWRSYRGRADCESRIKELKNDFGLDSFNLNSFYATEAALGFAMLAYNLMSTFRQAVMRAKIQPTLATLHQQVLAVGAFWNRDPNRTNCCLRFHDEEGPGLRAYGQMQVIRLCCRFGRKSANGLSGFM